MLRDIIHAIEKEVLPVGQEVVPAIRALGRVAARTVKAGRDLPAFDVSALDGFACKGNGKAFTIKAWLGPHEKPALRLAAGEAAFVPTGAAIPANTRFVAVEHVKEGSAGIVVETAADTRKVWKKGHWMRKGDVAISRGQSITPYSMELLALAGAEKIAVFRKPRVSILSTGNELKKGIVPRSNQSLLAGLTEKDGGEVVHTAVAGDDEAEICKELSSIPGTDLLLVTGGTAKGKKDVTRSSFQACGASLLLDALPVVPGKTMPFGKLNEMPFFILPGNPIAVRTLYEVFVRPCLLKLAGRKDSVRRGKIRVPRDIEKAHRIHLIPVAISIDGDPQVRALGVDEPDAILILEGRRKRVPAGKEVEVQWTDRACEIER